MRWILGGPSQSSFHPLPCLALQDQYQLLLQPPSPSLDKDSMPPPLQLLQAASTSQDYLLLYFQGHAGPAGAPLKHAALLQ